MVILMSRVRMFFWNIFYLPWNKHSKCLTIMTRKVKKDYIACCFHWWRVLSRILSYNDDLNILLNGGGSGYWRWIRTLALVLPVSLETFHPQESAMSTRDLRPGGISHLVIRSKEGVMRAPTRCVSSHVLIDSMSTAQVMQLVVGGSGQFVWCFLRAASIMT